MTGRLDSEVIIIGGGATGAGIARDCARRGLRTLLIERHDIATGATGRRGWLFATASEHRGKKGSRKNGKQDGPVTHGALLAKH